MVEFIISPTLSVHGLFAPLIIAPVIVVGRQDILRALRNRVSARHTVKLRLIGGTLGPLLLLLLALVLLAERATVCIRAKSPAVLLLFLGLARRKACVGLGIVKVGWVVPSATATRFIAWKTSGGTVPLAVVTVAVAVVILLLIWVPEVTSLAALRRLNDRVARTRCLSLFVWLSLKGRLRQTFIVSVGPLRALLLAPDLRVIDETIPDRPFRCATVILVIADVLGTTRQVVR